MKLIEVPDISPAGWPDPAAARKRASSCCEELEDGQILWFRGSCFGISEGDRRFLYDIEKSISSSAKNISFDQSTGRLEGYAGSRGDTLRLQQILTSAGESFRQFVAEMLSPYAQYLQADLISLRPIEEQERDLPNRMRNDLIHIDAFPGRPARDRRILRFFTNLHWSKPRVWITTETFEQLADQMALDAGLIQCASVKRGILPRIKSWSGRPKARSRYDLFMLRFHDYLKMNADFQARCDKQYLEFQPGCTWFAFTDAVPHAVVSGQFALEQTFFLPVMAMFSSSKSPLRILEKLAGCALI
jgi:3-deoxy-D-manno-octulosonic acid hydroxylase-like protein